MVYHGGVMFSALDCGLNVEVEALAMITRHLAPMLHSTQV